MSAACFLGALVPFPIPYIAAVGVVSIHRGEEGPFALILMVVAATAANTLGDVLDYLVGKIGWVLTRGGRKSAQTETFETRWRRIISNRPALIPLFCVLFGLTPLPDSLLFMPLGLSNYSLPKLLLWNALGKLLMFVAVALMGIHGLSALQSLFDHGGFEHRRIPGMAALYALWAVMAVIIRKR